MTLVAQWTNNPLNPLATRRQSGYWAPSSNGALACSPMPRRLSLSARAEHILGENGVTRFREFAAYRDGWDFGHGKALTAHSALAFEQFLAEYAEFGPRRPSLFLSRDGQLTLAWEDPAGKRVEVDFGPRELTLFLARDDSERVFAFPAELADLIAAIPR